MDGSDDYFPDDDLVFDDATLAAIDQQEQKALQQQQRRPEVQRTVSGQRRPIFQGAILPAAKKQKTSHGAAPDGLLPQIRAISVSDDYDEDLPDISIVGDGSYKFPAAQRESANELAAQIRRSPADPNGASTSHQDAPAPVRAPTLPQRPLLRTSSSSSHGAGSAASGSGQAHATSTVRPPQGTRPSRQSTLSSIQAALADFIPPPSHPPPAPTPSAQRQTSRASPVPAPSRDQYTNARPSRPPFSASRPPVQKPQSGTSALQGAQRQQRGTRASSPSISVPVDRQQATTGPSRPRVASPSAPPPPVSQPLPPSTQGQSERNLRIEVEMLKAQLEGLLKAQQQTSTELEEARNARYAKEGEVSILRKSIEKAAKDHAAEVARIKAAKEEAEAVQVKLRKEMREEIERVKTQYVFKQHELETSNRKTPWSVRTNRIDHLPPPTPISAASQKRIAGATPIRPRETELPESPTRKHRKKVVQLPATPPEKQSNRLGFVNSFAPGHANSETRTESSQLMPSQVARTKKGKERAVVEVDDSILYDDNPFDVPAEHVHQSPQSSAFVQRLRGEPVANAKGKQPEAGPRSSHYPLSAPNSSPDLPFEPPAEANEDVAIKDDMPILQEPSGTPLLTPDWTQELQRIILTHRHLSTGQPTLQMLLKYTLPSSASPDDVQTYATQSAKLLDVLAPTTLKALDTPDAIHSISDTLLATGRILCNLQSADLLAALLDMLKIIALFIPFVPLVLAPVDGLGGGDLPPKILDLLCNVVREVLHPREESLDDRQRDVAAETMGLLEAIVWNTPPELAMRLTVVIRTPDVLSVLLNARQPAWLLQRALRVFCLMASYPGMHKQFLTLDLSDSDDEREYNRIPHIECLASLLKNDDYDGPEGRSLRMAIIQFIGSLLHREDDTRAILLRSETLVPSMVVLLMRVSDPMYEEDEAFLASPDLVAWTISMIRQIMVILCSLFKGADYAYLRHKLTAHKRSFPGLWHMFTVAVGRVSYCELPTVLSWEHQQKMEVVSDAGRELLEMVVNAPELESIWAAFQVDVEHAAPKAVRQSDDENDARLLDPGSDIE